MSSSPLTHHEILTLVAPLARQGWAVDMAASDRMARRLLFKPQHHAEAGLTETLLLDEPEHGGWRLARALVDTQGLRASAYAQGDDIAELLQRVQAVPAPRHYSRGAGWAIAWSLRLGGDAPIVMHAELRLEGLTVKMSASPVQRIPAELELVAGAGAGANAGRLAELPQDLLAVLGRAWSRLDKSPHGWRARLDLRGRGAERSADAERQLQLAARHLVQTFAEPPAHFHDQRVAARWGVTLRRAVPLAVCLGVIGAALAVPLLNLSQDSVLRMLIFNAPPIMLGLLFALREMPRVEIPPLPRRPTAPRWRMHSTEER